MKFVYTCSGCGFESEKPEGWIATPLGEALCEFCKLPPDEPINHLDSFGVCDRCGQKIPCAGSILEPSICNDCVQAQCEERYHL